MAYGTSQKPIYFLLLTFLYGSAPDTKMNSGIAEALGGLGVFLLGMVVMTSGLKSLAGNALRNALARFTRSPLSGAISGALATALIQSSSATTVTAVGFVGAGLITFSQALGIIFGANIGTTVTGWLVAILGFKIKIGARLCRWCWSEC